MSNRETGNTSIGLPDFNRGGPQRRGREPKPTIICSEKKLTIASEAPICDFARCSINHLGVHFAEWLYEQITGQCSDNQAVANGAKSDHRGSRNWVRRGPDGVIICHIPYHELACCSDGGDQCTIFAERKHPCSLS